MKTSFSSIIRRRVYSTQAGSQRSFLYHTKNLFRKNNPLLGPIDNEFPFPGVVSHQTLQRKVPECTKIELPKADLKDLISSFFVEANFDLFRKEAMKITGCIKMDCDKWLMEIKAQKCPEVLQKDLKQLFSNLKTEYNKINVINFTQKTGNDMATWSENIETEREIMSSNFISLALVVSSALNSYGYWADFVDPTTGHPYLGRYLLKHELFETDDAYKHMGFHIEDLGCCQVLKHLQWDSHIFVGSLFTDAPLDSIIVQAIISELHMK